MKNLLFASLALAVGLTGPAFAGGNGLTITVDSLASEWSSATAAVPGVIIPVGGAGQLNGNFILPRHVVPHSVQRWVPRFCGLKVQNHRMLSMAASISLHFVGRR